MTGKSETWFEVEIVALSFETRDQADAYRDAVTDAICALSESQSVTLITAIKESDEAGAGRVLERTKG